MALNRNPTLGRSGIGGYVLLATVDGSITPRVTLTPHRLMGTAQRLKRRNPTVECGPFDTFVGDFADAADLLLNSMTGATEAIVRSHVAQRGLAGGPSPLDRLKALVARLEGAR